MKTLPTIGINGLFLRKPGTGIGQVTRHFLQVLAEESDAPFRYRVYVDEREREVSLGTGGEVFYLKPWWPRDDLIRKLLWEHIQLPQRALKDKVDAFLSLYQAPTELPRSVRHLMVVHDLIPEIFSQYTPKIRQRFFWNLTKRAIKKANVLVAVSQSTKRDVEKYLNVASEKIYVAYPSIDPVFFHEVSVEERVIVLEKYQLAPGYLYHGGGLEVRKNTEAVLTAYAAWRATARPDEVVPPLVISGFLHNAANPLATNVEALARKLKIKEHVKLLGFVPAADLPALYQNAALFVFPSLYEGFGMPVVEALSQGTAVLAFRNSSLGEVGGESVFWTETLTKDDLEKSYQAASQSSPEEKAVRQLQARNFQSWNGFVKKIGELLIQ